MKKLRNITVTLIDDNNQYQYMLANRLYEIGVDVSGRFTHNQRYEIQDSDPTDVIILSYRDSLDETQETIKLVKTKFPVTKIIVSVAQEDKQTVPVVQLQQAGIDGLFYKDDISLTELQVAVESVKEGKSYFQNPKKKFP